MATMEDDEDYVTVTTTLRVPTEGYELFTLDIGALLSLRGVVVDKWEV